jgi:DNA ligase (NAD+)
MARPSIDALRTEIRRADAAYRAGTPLISDEQFDNLVAQLRAAAPYAPELNHPGGGTALLSLDNCSMADWYHSISLVPAVVVQPKIDGIAIAIRYKSGILTDAWTRSGKCILPLVRTISAIPQIIREGGDIEIHGELFGTDPKRSQTDAAQAAAANTRRRKPTATDKRVERKLDFYAYRLHACTGTESVSLEFISRLGIKVVDSLLCTKPVEVARLHAKWLDGQLFTHWSTDGIIVKVHDHTLQQQLGASTVAPRWALALKR